MSKTYIAMPARPAKAWDDWYEGRAIDHLPRTVHEADSAPRDTGLLDKDGRKLFAVTTKRPIGFVWTREDAR